MIDVVEAADRVPLERLSSSVIMQCPHHRFREKWSVSSCCHRSTTTELDAGARANLFVCRTKEAILPRCR